MSLLNYLQFQKIDQSSDDITAEHCPQDDILLDDQWDGVLLEKFWDRVVQDIHEDPEWFRFDDE